MKSVRYLFLPLLSVFSVATAEETASAEKKSEWIELFDGETLEGWEEIRHKDTFRVEDGTIVGKADPGHPTTFLCPVQEFEDFELEFEVFVKDRELNSGVQVRSIRRNGNGSLIGPQVEINAKRDLSRSGLIFGQGYGQWFTPEEEMKNNPHLKGTDWNQVRVLVEGRTISTWINGEPITVTELSDEIYENHKSGKIGLQVHAIRDDAGPWEVAFRNIKVREL